MKFDEILSLIIYDKKIQRILLSQQEDAMRSQDMLRRYRISVLAKSQWVLKTYAGSNMLLG